MGVGGSERVLGVTFPPPGHAVHACSCQRNTEAISIGTVIYVDILESKQKGGEGLMK